MAGLGTACPSAAYDDVIESITDWAFSSPISATISSMPSQCQTYQSVKNIR